MDLNLKTNPMNGFLLRSSTKPSRTVRLAEFKLPIRSVEVRQINVKRKMRNQEALAARKKPRKGLETQVADSVTSYGNEQIKSSKSRKRWCRRCGIIETCRWRTSPAGSQTYVTVLIWESVLYAFSNPVFDIVGLAMHVI
jgi:hypothetical protein